METSCKRPYKGESTLNTPDQFVVIDIETTGLNPSYDDIIELAALKIEDDNIIEEFETLVNPEYDIPSNITKLTGITTKMVRDAPYIENALQLFLQFIGDYHIVGHNVHFDVNFIYDNACNFEVPPPTANITDTLRLSRRTFPELCNHRLETVARRCGASSKNHHRALADCYITYHCYEFIKDFIKENEIDLYSRRCNVNRKDTAPKFISRKEAPLIMGKTFVFTGSLKNMSREEAFELVINSGGKCKNNVTQKTNYLVLGDYKDCFWIKGEKSKKHLKAEELKSKGYKIEIISESTFYDMCELKTNTESGVNCGTTRLV